MNNVKATVSAIALATIGSLGCASAQSVYSFGDSLSDIGSVNQLSLGLVAGNDYFFGRFSNGYVWVDYLSALSAKAEQETLQGLIGPFFTTSAQGFNFAHGGAVTGELSPDVDTSLFGQELAFLSQIGAFRTTDQAAHFRDQRVFGRRAFIVNPRDFATISAGGNDYFNGETDVGRVIGNLLTSVEFIRQGGLNNILLLDLPSVGETPGSILTADRAELNALSAAHNSLLRQEAASYEAANPNAFLAIVPAARLFEIAILDATTNNSQLLGFSNVGPTGSSTGTCLGDGLVLSACPDSYLFYDDVHPTRRAHALLAEAAVATVRAKLAGDALPLSSSRSAKQGAAAGNQLIASRFAAFEAGFTASGLVTTAAEAFLSGSGAGVGAQSLTTTGPAALVAASGMSVYGFSEGHELLAPSDLHLAGVSGARAFSLTMNEGETLNSFGADYLSKSNFAVGALFTHAELDRRQLWASTEDELVSFSVYGAWFDGPLTVNALLRSSRTDQTYRRDTGFAALPTLQGRATSYLRESRVDARYHLAQLANLTLSAVGRLSTTHLQIRDFGESGTMGLFERAAPASDQRGLAGYVGLKSDVHLPRSRGNLSFEGGQLQATNRSIGFSTLLEDAALVDDAVDDIAVDARFGAAATEGQYAALGWTLQPTEDVLLTGRAAYISTLAGHDSTASLSLAWRF